MKNLRKYFLLAVVLAFVPVCANAELSVKDTTSPEFIHNQGYSSEVSRIIEVRTKDPVTPIAVSEEKHPVWKSFGWTLLETIDPSYERPGKFVNHDTKFNRSSPQDL